jgi:hypothetical protein
MYKYTFSVHSLDDKQAVVKFINDHILYRDLDEYITERQISVITGVKLKTSTLDNLRRDCHVKYIYTKEL